MLVSSQLAMVQRIRNSRMDIDITASPSTEGKKIQLRETLVEEGTERL